MDEFWNAAGGPGAGDAGTGIDTGEHRTTPAHGRTRRIGVTVALIVGSLGAAGVAGAVASGTGSSGSGGSPAAQGGPGGHGPRGVIGGTVTAVTTGAFTVAQGTGPGRVVDTSPSTVYDEPGTTVTPTGVTVGEHVRVQLARPPTPTPTTTTTTTAAAASTADTTPGPTTAPPVPTALRVDILLPRVAGTVSSVTGSTIVVTTRGTTTRDVIVSDSTTYTADGAAATLADVTAGLRVSAVGPVDATDTTGIDAVAVVIGPAPSSAGGSDGPTASTPGWDPGRRRPGTGDVHRGRWRHRHLHRYRHGNRIRIVGPRVGWRSVEWRHHAHGTGTSTTDPTPGGTGGTDGTTSRSPRRSRPVGRWRAVSCSRSPVTTS